MEVDGLGVRSRLIHLRNSAQELIQSNSFQSKNDSIKKLVTLLERMVSSTVDELDSVPYMTDIIKYLETYVTLYRSHLEMVVQENAMKLQQVNELKAVNMKLEERITAMQSRIATAKLQSIDNEVGEAVEDETENEVEKWMKIIMDELHKDEDSVFQDTKLKSSVLCAAGKTKEAITLVESKLSEFSEDSLYRSDLLTNIGNFFVKLGDFETARINYQNALSIRDKRRDRSSTNKSTLYHNMAVTYINLKRYDDAMKCAKLALELKRKIHGAQSPEYAKQLCCKAHVESKLHNYEEALELCHEALTIYQSKTPLHDDGRIKCVNRMAALYLNLQKTGNALQLLQITICEMHNYLYPNIDTAESIVGLIEGLEDHNIAARKNSELFRQAKMLQPTFLQCLQYFAFTLSKSKRPLSAELVNAWLAACRNAEFTNTEFEDNLFC